MSRTTSLVLINKDRTRRAFVWRTCLLFDKHWWTLIAVSWALDSAMVPIIHEDRRFAVLLKCIEILYWFSTEFSTREILHWILYWRISMQRSPSWSPDSISHHLSLNAPCTTCTCRIHASWFMPHGWLTDRRFVTVGFWLQVRDPKHRRQVTEERRGSCDLRRLFEC